MSLLLIDADILVYKAMSSVEHEICWYDDVWTLYGDVAEASAVFRMMLERISDRLKSDDVLCCFSDTSNNFRKQIDPTYKSNRKGTRKPVGIGALVSWVEAHHKSLRKPSLEADDLLGILASKPENSGKVIMVSDDKDLKTISGRLYRPQQDELLDVSQKQADAYFLQQCLTGDTADGYKGCKGVGEKTAQKILGSRPTWAAVEQAYIKAGMTKEDALQQARLARILRWSEWSEEKGEPILWTPS